MTINQTPANSLLARDNKIIAEDILHDHCDVLIVGAGPAGMMLALLLAQKGRAVTVIEKNPDFAREFRGEVLQPRFWHAVKEAGIEDILKAAPHETFDHFKVFVGSENPVKIDISRIDKDFPHVTWMTQPHMLQALHDAAKEYAGFKIIFESHVKQLSYSDDGISVCGALCEDASGNISKIQARIVVGADGRFSTLRKLGGFKVIHSTHQFDVLWFECKRPSNFAHGADFFLGTEFTCLVLPKYPQKIQFGLIISPASFRIYRELGPEKLAQKLDQIHPMFREFSKELINFKSFTILKATTERLDRWSKNGLLMIGDAAHTCSPIGAIGVTIAVETAIVASNVIQGCFRDSDFSEDRLREVETLRLPAIRKIHRIQEILGRLATNRIIPRKLVLRLLPLIVSSPLFPKVLRAVISRRQGSSLLMSSDQ